MTQDLVEGGRPGRAVALSGRQIAGIVGFLVCVELASGVLQGYYTPIYTDIARHLHIADADVNWFEAAQLMVSALVLPILARLGDLIGHRRVLLLATVVTAVASWGLAVAPTFWTFLVAWAIQGFYVVWLPMEIAIIHRRTAGDERRTRVAASVLVAALELGVIVAAIGSGALAGTIGMTGLLALPAVVVTAAWLAIYYGVPHVPVQATGRVDWRGFWLVTVALALVMAGLMVLRLTGPGSLWPWVILLAGLAAFVPFGRLELRVAEPLVDLRILRAPGQWPIQLAAALIGASLLGAQIPLSTFARTDPAVAGYGLGASAGKVSYIIGGYVLSLAVGALLLPAVARPLGARWTLALGALLVAVGYLLFLVRHDSLAQLISNMVVAGLGSGALVAALPAAAATEAPATHTGFVTGMTNTTKTLGGAIASSVYAISLSATGSIDTAGAVHAPMSGYLTVWAICGGTALVAAAALAAMALRGRRAGRPALQTTPTGHSLG